MAVDTKRQEFIDFYFQSVQDKIKELLSEDPKISSDDIQKFNDMIFTQKEEDVRKDIQEYINVTASEAVDVDIVAKNILDRYYDMVFFNNFNKDTINDIENPLDEKKLLNFDEFIKESESKKNYFVPWSSWFDLNPYDIDKIKETISLFINDEFIWVENHFGWENQPEVVCFLAIENIIPKIAEKLNVVFDTQWIRINEKDW